MGIYGGVGYKGKPYGGYRVGTHGRKGGGGAAPEHIEVLVRKADRCAMEPVDLEDMRYCRDCQHVWYGVQANCPACWGQRADRYERKQIGLRIYLFPTARGTGAQRHATMVEFQKDKMSRSDKVFPWEVLLVFGILAVVFALVSVVVLTGGRG